MNAPPLLVSYSSLKEYKLALGEALVNEFFGELEVLYGQKLPPVASARCLSVLFGISTPFIHKLANKNTKYYRTFKIPKGKKSRTINAPKAAPKVIQKWFGHHLSRSLTFGEFVFGFVPGKSVLQAAQQHVLAKWVYRVDIKDFFVSIPHTAVVDSLIQCGYSPNAAVLMSKICCYGETLAQGAPSSPVLANLAFRSIDAQLFELARVFGVRMTRYADDIVFSSADQEFPAELPDRLREIFALSCWQLSTEKENLAKHPARLKVHGLLVHGPSVRLTKGYRNKIRAYEHLLRKDQILDKDLARIQGHLNYARNISS